MNDRIIVALDVDTLDEALDIIGDIGEQGKLYKVGLQLLSGMGPSVFGAIRLRYPWVRFFYDGKLNDIPNTMATAAKNAATSPGVQFISAHASSGVKALSATAAAADPAVVLAVTALTSLDDKSCVAIFGVQRTGTVVALASLAQQAGVGGIICSPNELAELKRMGVASNMLKVVPGIRPLWAAPNDQEAFNTPGAAVANGAHYIVVGRPITQPPTQMRSRRQAFEAVVEEIKGAV